MMRGLVRNRAASGAKDDLTTLDVLRNDGKELFFETHIPLRLVLRDRARAKGQDAHHSLHGSARVPPIGPSNQEADDILFNKYPNCTASGHPSCSHCVD